MTASTNNASDSLSPDKWLEAALIVLQKEGINGVKIVTIAKALGVTTGSFYWHFRDRDDLLRSVLEYWATEMTARVIEDVETAGVNDPRERLLLLMQSITAGHRADYETAVRAWAAYDPGAARIVRKVDQQRLATIRTMFRDMGFHGDDLEMRTRLLLAAEMGEPALLVRDSAARRRKLIEGRHALLTKA